MATDDNKLNQPPRRKSRLRRILVTCTKIVLWTAMAVVLAVWGTLVCCVSVLKPEALTPLAQRVANSMLNADVTIGRVELNMEAHFPFLRIDVDSLTIIARDIKRLTPELRSQLPIYADTLLTMEHFGGGINIAKILSPAGMQIALSDIELRNPRVAIARLDSAVCNYNIYTSAPSETTDTTTSAMPRISIDRFRVTGTMPIRYYDAEAGQEACVTFSAIDLEAGAMPQAKADDLPPYYAVTIRGDVSSPLLSMVNLRTAPFGFDGRISWSPDRPMTVAIDDATLSAHCVNIDFATTVNMEQSVRIDRLEASLAPTDLADILAMVPEPVLRNAGIKKTFSTDLKPSLSVKLTRPYDLATDTIPHATIALAIPPGHFRSGAMRFESIGANIGVTLRGNNLDAALVSINDMVLAGPATRLTLDATVSRLLSDPTFDARLHGRCNLSQLPPVMTQMIPGKISGRITADIQARGSLSMLSPSRFYRLYVTGDIDADDLLCHLPAQAAVSDSDTIVNGDTDLYARHACFTFGTRNRFTHGEHAVDSLLSLSLQVDTASMLVQGLCDMQCAGLKMGVGTANKVGYNPRDSNVVIPIGAMMQTSRLDMNMPADSIKLRSQGLGGYITLKRNNGDKRLPLITMDLKAERLRAQDNINRISLRQVNINASLAKQPKRQRKISAALQRAADSISALYPDISADSAMVIARAERRRARAAAAANDSTEKIDWGTDDDTRRLLRDWRFAGSLKAKRAGLRTPYFPLRNRIRNFNLSFNNDSIWLDSITYKVGRTDLTISGNISNISRSLTSRSRRQNLKLQFNVTSDTIDINQLADATFRGSAYIDATGDDDDDGGESNAAPVAPVIADTATVTPLLIPTNIEGQIRVKARNIIYADLLLHRFRGELNLYDGAVNLNRLRASSDIGSIELSALYSAPKVSDIKFGFGLLVKRFDIDRFMTLIPALDSIMPIMRDFSGIINADIAATADIDRNMNMVLPSLNAAVQLRGDSLTVIDQETFKTISKWLLFKNKNRNMIDSMSVELTVKDNMLQLYPFIFNFDRYRLGVQGSNDLAMNFDYHVAVLKSPIPFKFGITIKGNADDFKIRLGKARFNEKTASSISAATDTTRINLINQIEGVFRRGVSRAKFSTLDIKRRPRRSAITTDNDSTDTISAADSLMLINEGLLEAPPQPATPDTKSSTKKSKSKRRKQQAPQATAANAEAIMPDDTNIIK